MNPVRSLLAFFPCIALLIAGPRIVQGQPRKFEGTKIVNIRFDPPDQPLEPTELFEMLPLKKDQPLHMNVVRASIERLFASGRYSDIQVDADPYDDGVIVTFRTKNSWFIGNVSVAGRLSDPPNPGQLVNATRL